MIESRRLRCTWMFIRKSKKVCECWVSGAARLPSQLNFSRFRESAAAGGSGRIPPWASEWAACLNININSRVLEVTYTDRNALNIPDKLCKESKQFFLFLADSGEAHVLMSIYIKANIIIWLELWINQLEPGRCNGIAIMELMCPDF